MAGNFDGIKKQRFGIEIELTGITRDEAAEAIAELFDTDYDHYGGNYDRYDVSDAKGRTWKIVYDSSIHNVNHNHHPTSNSHYAVEVVSPILEYEDIPQLQEVVRALRKAGGITGAEYGCGIHIRITPCHLKRADDSGREVICKGYWFEVFADESMTIPLDVFGGAVGFELVEDSMDEAVQFMKDVVDAEEKRYWELLKEME